MPNTRMCCAASASHVRRLPLRPPAHPAQEGAVGAEEEIVEGERVGGVAVLEHCSVECKVVVLGRGILEVARWQGRAGGGRSATVRAQSTTQIGRRVTTWQLQPPSPSTAPLTHVVHALLAVDEEAQREEHDVLEQPEPAPDRGDAREGVLKPDGTARAGSKAGAGERPAALGPHQW